MPGQDEIPGAHRELTAPPSPGQGRNSSSTDRDRPSAVRSDGKASRDLDVPGNHGKRKLPPEFERSEDSPNPRSQRVRSKTATQGTSDQIIERCLLRESREGSEAYAASQGSPIEPPITLESLAQLDWPRLLNNEKFRYDLNFDRAVRYGPHLDGIRRRQKMDLADVYWKALRAEMLMLCLAQRQRQVVTCSREQEHWQNVARASRKRLSCLLKALRDILLTLVPKVERPEVVARLDVDLIVQEIDNGMCDLVDLASWVAKKLKSHCASMRDGLVNKMQASLTQGGVEGKPNLQVTSLCQLLNILEAMKLDLANSRIRHTQQHLVQDTVSFHQQYNRQRISLGKLDAKGSREWLEREIQYIKTSTGADPDRLEVLVTAVLRDLLLTPNVSELPPTFYLDLDRLWALRREMHKIICQRICCDILMETIERKASRLVLASAVRALPAALSAIVDAACNWLDRAKHIAAQIVRIVHMLDGCTQSYASELLSCVERKLQTTLTPMSAVFCAVAHGMLDHLLPKVRDSVRTHEHLPALQLQEALLPPSSKVAARPLGRGVINTHLHHVPRPMDAETSIVRRFTHTIVLHWQIWAQLVYLAPSQPRNGTRVTP